ncbi:hypothetical protein AMATHDRAFT_49601 [Amanita thiersii Skay4041]|uniref:DUF6533 domain-containing protein n=1 Tax=Amanita thiersii Skay4041 TaxID=703135 RepID=A0A2A9NKX7_9AGAR|nr:hypothetical protein AMATHDRAFT_49601 [Amanita thiersii Skay4041]
MVDLSPDALARRALVRLCTTASAFLLSFDTFYMFQQECHFIWCTPSPITLVKCIYLFSRYFILLFQIFDLAYGDPSPENCMQVLVLCAVRRNNGITINVRNHSHVESISTTVLALCDSHIDDACVATNTPRGVIEYAVVICAQQLLIWGLTLMRWSFLKTMDDAGRRLNRVMIRDGTWVLVSVCAIMSVTTPYSIYIDQVTHVMFSIMIPLFSISVGCRLSDNEKRLLRHTQTCRLVINMQSLAIESLENDSQELTSIQASSNIESSNSAQRQD